MKYVKKMNQKYLIIHINESYVNCFDFKKCYSTCESCEGKGNELYHRCLKCKNEYKFLMNSLFNTFNCYNTCDNYFYIDTSTNITFCTPNKTCPIEYNKLIINKNECIDDCMKDPEYIYEYNNICYNTSCHPDCKICKGTYSYNTTNCISCNDNNKYLYLGNCVTQCPRNDSFYDEEIDQNICKCELEQCKSCDIISLNEKLCIECDEGYYPIFNIDNTYLNCTKEPEGYYFNNEMKVYIQCFNSCKTCDIEGNINKHNCKICKDNFNFEMPYENYKNCYEICENYYYYDEINNISKCTKTPECPIDYNKLILEEKKCIDYCGKNFNYK